MKRSEINALFERYGPMIYRRARYILGNDADAEEAAQDVFVKALRSNDGFEKRSQVSTWLYRITTNHCLNVIRDRNTRRGLLERHADQLREPPTTPASPSDIMLMRQLLTEAPEELARVAVFVHIDGMRHHEVAEVLGVSRRTVGNLLERFKQWALARCGEASSETS